MRTSLRFLIMAILATSWVAISAQEYHIQEGFDGSTPDGWTTSNTYNGSSDNNGVLPGEKAIKMKATYAEVYLPSVIGAGVLTYWTKPNNDFADGVLLVEKSVDDGTTWSAIDTVLADGSVTAYEEQTVTIDEAESVIIRFVAEGGTGTSTLFMLDDVQLTKLAPKEDDANLASMTMNGLPVPGFSASQVNYELTINFTTEIPQFDGVANNPAATVTATQLTDLQGDEAARTATIEVVAEDGVTTQTYSIVVTVSMKHFESGFGNASVDSMGSVWPGWETDATFITSNIPSPPGNSGVIDGTSALKFMNKNEGDAPYLQSPSYEKIATLSFWLFIEAPRSGEAGEIVIEAVTGGVATEIATIAESELATDAWTEFSYELNIVEATNILFSADLPGDWDGDMSTSTRLWMDDITITADPELGETDVVNSSADAIGLSVYPNPVNNQLFIETNSVINQVSLYNITGKLVYTSVNQLNSVNMENLESGLYILKVETENGTTSRKIHRN